MAGAYIADGGRTSKHVEGNQEEGKGEALEKYIR